MMLPQPFAHALGFHCRSGYHNVPRVGPHPRHTSATHRPHSVVEVWRDRINRRRGCFSSHLCMYAGVIWLCAHGCAAEPKAKCSLHHYPLHYDDCIGDHWLDSVRITGAERAPGAHTLLSCSGNRTLRRWLQ